VAKATKKKTSRPSSASRDARRPARATRSRASSNGKLRAAGARDSRASRKAARKSAPRLEARTQATAPPAPAARAVKPGKNPAGLKAKDLEFFRGLLLAKRRELLGDVVSMEEEALRSTTGTNLSNLPIHMADMGTDNYEQEFTLHLVEKDRQLLREINHALAKIRDGTYGICEGTGKPIARARLEAQPWARYSIEYARQMEKGLMRS